MSNLYAFKEIKPVHSSSQLIDVVLSKTQRKTPTEVHPGYQIQRIREFYMRKVKFASEAFTDKLKESLNGFPKLSDIHPFFADWLNVLYDKDHYKIALGQLNMIVNVIEKIQKDYVKLMKYADSLYRCKTLKVAAMGRMCTAVKKLKPSLEYLEEVRRHVARLPSIDPFAPTLLLFGFPNVGKSSFINKITRANVEVSPIPFSTQSLFIGHTFHSNVKIQVIDSPGVLDRALDQRNTIEMQSLTALAHLKTAVLFIVDISENCGHSLVDQLSLFESLKPLFAKKPVTLILNKVDLVSFENLDDSSKELLKNFNEKNPEVAVLQLSTTDDKLIEETKDYACKIMLESRQNNKKDASLLKTDEDYLSGVRVVLPTKKRRVEPTEYIPESVIKERTNQVKEPIKTLKELQEEFGGAGVFAFPSQEHFLLENEEWKYDAVPEIINGKNIWDYVDPDIEARLEELEKENMNELGMDEEMIIDAEELEDLATQKQINGTIPMLKLSAKLNRHVRVKKQTANLQAIKRRLQAKGKNPEEEIARVTSKIADRMSARRKRSKDNNEMEIEDEEKEASFGKRLRDARENQKSISQREKWFKSDNVAEMRRRKIQKQSLKRGEAGDADRRVTVKKPKHLFAGKMSMGTSNKR